MDTPRIAVVGCGNWSSEMHLPAMCVLASQGEAEYVGVCDLDEARAKEYAAKLDVNDVFADVDTMLDTVTPDGVALLVRPSQVTTALIRKAVERQLPFIAEKPPAPTTDEHRLLVEQVGDLTHVVAYNRRHSPYIVKALEWLDGCDIQSVTGMFCRYRRREPDFTGTAVHGIDTVRCLAREDIARLSLGIAPGGQTNNYFLNGWTSNNTRVDLLITPDTGSAVEHYIVRTEERTVVVHFPMHRMIDVPGYVELHEGNEVAARMGPADFGLEDHDLPGLGGILREEQVFAQALKGEAEPECVLANTLQTQLIREELGKMLEAGEQQRELVLD